MKGMTNTEAFEIALIKSKVSKSELAKKLGISLQALYNKINVDDEAEFKASEIVNITKILKLSKSERELIFFANSVE